MELEASDITTTLAFTLNAPCQCLQTKTQLVSRLKSNQKQVLVAYGTSLTAEGAWVAQLNDILQKKYPDLTTVINSGGSGQWSKWGIENLDARVIQKKPDVVFIEFSINDSVERFDCSVEQSQTHLQEMIRRILQSHPNCEIILMTMTLGHQYPRGHRSHRKDITPYHAMYRNVAEQHNLTLIDHDLNWRSLQTKNEDLFHIYVPDGIHPTDEGCSKIVTPAMLKVLKIHEA